MSERTVGTVVRGIRGPIIREGDDLAQIVVDSVLAASKAENFEFHDRDVIAVTEAVVGRAQGNYCTIDDIATDIKEKFPSGVFGLIIISQLRQMMKTVVEKSCFVKENVKSLNIMTVSSFCIFIMFIIKILIMPTPATGIIVLVFFIVLP